MNKIWHVMNTDQNLDAIFYSAHDHRHIVWFLSIHDASKQNNGKHKQHCKEEHCDVVLLPTLLPSIHIPYVILSPWTWWSAPSRTETMRFYYYTQSFTSKISFILQRPSDLDSGIQNSRVGWDFFVCRWVTDEDSSPKHMVTYKQYDWT